MEAKVLGSILIRAIKLGISSDSYAQCITNMLDMKMWMDKCRFITILINSTGVY